MYIESLPEDKLDIVRSLEDNHISFMVGDGIDDAPSFRRTNVSFSMGSAGNRLLMDSSDIDLLEDPEAALLAGNYNDVKVMRGYNKLEDKTFMFSDSIVNDADVDVLIHDVFINDPKKAIGIYEDDVRTTYDKMVEVVSLTCLILPMKFIWDAMVANGTDVYAFQFNYIESKGAIPDIVRRSVTHSGQSM